MRLVKTAQQSDWGYGFGGTGCSYRVEGTNITVTPVAGRWRVSADGNRVHDWDSFKWAKEHALELAAIDPYDEPICDKYATSGVAYDPE